MLLISHGDMAKGMVNSAKMFFGDEIEQFDCCCFYADVEAEIFKEELAAKINDLNQGDGVMILCDIYGGSPAKMASEFINDEVTCITGMNFPMLLQMLSSRIAGEENVKGKIEKAGKDGIKEWNPHQEINIENSFF
ncbi:MAG: PTS sugar transporter subunit IIA [Erysipelotrichaceae bacterium]|nr:PTS sugar transporter subunit IIA [Erysipelotrichaceae bacterium]